MKCAQAGIRGLQSGIAFFPRAGGVPAGLQGLQCSQGFIDVTTRCKIVYIGGAKLAIRIDDESSAQGDSHIFDQDAVISGNVVVGIPDDGVAEIL